MAARLSVTGSAQALPTHATTRLSAHPSVWHRWPRIGVFAPLAPPLRNRAVARASTRATRAPRYTVCDTAERGAAYYARQHTPPEPHFTPLQAALLDGVRRLRRWRYYADALDAECTANEPLDGCECRVCLDPHAARSERAYWRLASAPPRWHAPSDFPS